VAVALDPPGTTVNTDSPSSSSSSSSSSRIMLLFPSCHFPFNGCVFDDQIAYVSPLLAFNLNLHVACLKSVLHHGQEALASYFGPREKSSDEDAAKSTADSVINVELEPLALPPKFASLLRVSFVKIPECGILESIRASSPFESEERQNMIDLSLQKYFEVDRYLSKGDVFGINISWNCNSPICVPCNQRSLSQNDNLICFKVL